MDWKWDDPSHVETVPSEEEATHLIQETKRTEGEIKIIRAVAMPKPTTEEGSPPPFLANLLKEYPDGENASGDHTIIFAVKQPTIIPPAEESQFTRKEDITRRGKIIKEFNFPKSDTKE